MLFFALQVLLFTVMVDESLGCCGIFPTGRSLGERDVNFLIIIIRLPLIYMLKLLFQTLYYPYSQMIWKLYIGHLEFVPRMKRPVWRRDTMETISRKSPEYN